MPYWIAPLLGCLFMLATMAAAVYSFRQARAARVNRLASEFTTAEGARQVAAVITVRDQAQGILETIREENEITRPSIAVNYSALTAETCEDVGPLSLDSAAISGVIRSMR